MAQVKTIKNTSGVPQTVMYRGTQFALSPFDEQSYDAVIADLFLEKCAPIVVDTTEKIGDTFAPDLQAATTWVANMTGDPDAPDEIEVTVVSKDSRKWIKQKKPNPNRVARTISRELRGGQRQYTGKGGGLVNETVPSKTIEIPAYRRRPLPTGQADWFLNRDYASDCPGAVIRSRPPGDFEPEPTWPLDRLRAYLSFLEPTAGARGILGMSETDLANKVKNDKLDGTAAKELLRQVKHEIFKRLTFKVFNPLYKLPTRMEFEEFVTGKSVGQIEEAEVSALLEKAEAQANVAAATISRAKAQGQPSVQK